MLFTPDNADKVMRGRKTKTRRPVKTNQWLAQDPEDGRLAIFERTVKGVRVKWKVGRTYAVQPGRGKPAIGRVTLISLTREPLHAIDEDDCWREGISLGGAGLGAPTYRGLFQRLWDSIYRSPYAWGDNPDVWVLEFAVVSQAARCPCGCCHVPDHGACDTFERGRNGRCVYCDHGKECHPGRGATFNLPLAVGERRT